VCARAELDARALPAHELNKEAVTGSSGEVRIAMDFADNALAVEEGRLAGIYIYRERGRERMSR
jgi:hypothetical protein